jgi:hypothetical protein
MTKSRAPRMQRFWMMLVSVALVLFAGGASAAGRVEWKTKTLKESEGHSWTIEVAFYLNKPPDVATLPMRFSFMPVVYYERDLVDGKEGPQLRQVPLQGKPPLVEGVDVGFMDPGNGQIQKRTKFSFKVTRGHGYEAGEYDVTIKDGRTDQAFGAPAHVIFEGENEVIDRRAMVFSGEKKKEKAKEGEGSEGGGDDSAKPAKKQLDENDPAFWEGGPKKGSTENNEEVEPKRGCGCRLADSSSHDESAAAAALAVLAVFGGRRIRRRLVPGSGSSKRTA